MYSGLVRATTPPPRFLVLAAHPVRWQLLCELAYSDRQVGELVRLVGVGPDREQAIWLDS